jgi:hypothetical protein
MLVSYASSNKILYTASGLPAPNRNSLNNKEGFIDSKSVADADDPFESKARKSPAIGYHQHSRQQRSRKMTQDGASGNASVSDDMNA